MTIERCRRKDDKGTSEKKRWSRKAREEKMTK